MSRVVITHDGTLKAALLIRRAAGVVVKEAADEVLGISEPNVPVAIENGGFLRDSGEVDADLSAAKATVSYSSPPVAADGRRIGTGNVAVWVHENTTVRHTVGGAKFLERAFRSFRPRFESFLAAGIRRRVP